jgi:DnaK suppressor protein
MDHAEEVKAFVAEIRAERDRLIDELNREQGLAVDASAQLAEPHDDADDGSIEQAVDRAEPLAARTARRIDALEHFLERAAQSRAAICDRCGGPIAIARLRAVVGTTLCASCAQEVERELRRL